MSATCLRILDGQTLGEQQEPASATAVDLGDYDELELVVTVTSAGTTEADAGSAPALVLRHAPSAAADVLLDFPTPVSVDLTATGSTWIHVPYFTRWLFWSTSAALTTAATVNVEVVGRR